MKRILYIAPHSFPIKSSESICNSKVAYVLASMGYQIDVFACSDSSTYPKDSKIDQFLQEVPSMRIFTVRPSKKNFYRTASITSNLKCVPHNLKVFFKTGFYYNGISTPFAVLQAIEDLIKSEGGFHYDVMITRGFLTDVVGITLKKKYGVTWIANWNDPFPLKRFPAPYGQGYDAKLPFFENRVYEAIQKYADIHTFPSSRLRDYMLKCFTHVKKENTRVIHHMAHSELTQFFNKKNASESILKIVSCGSVGVPRKPEVFLKALSIALKEVNVKLKLFFVGFYSDSLKSLSKELRLSDIVEFIPPKRYSECMDLISSCDVSLIIETTCEEGIYLPTKCVDAFQCSKPIFCVSPKIGTLRDIVEKFHVGYISDIDNIDDVVSQIKRMLNDHLQHQLPVANKKIARQRLQFFKQHGASGIFFNGSGYSYSSFDEMRTFVLSALLINPELSVDNLTASFFNQEYPAAKKWLYDYYTDLENGTQSGKRLGIYAGIRESEKAYLTPEKFIKFYDEMNDFVSNAKGKERKKLHELQTALSYTRMEMGREHSFDAYGYAKRNGKSLQPIPQVQEWLTQLKEHKAFTGMEYYNESSDEIGNYIKEWEEYIFASDLKKNLFLGVTPSVIPQAYKSHIKKLTDGTHGLPGNYHCGWVIIPEEECTINLPVKGINTSGTIYISFLNLPRHRFYTPQQIELLKDGIIYKKIDLEPGPPAEKGEMVKTSIPADLNGTEQLSIRITCSKKPGAQIGIDEIAFIPLKADINVAL